MATTSKKTTPTKTVMMLALIESATKQLLDKAILNGAH